MEKMYKRGVFWICFCLLEKYRKENNLEDNKSVSGTEGINKIGDQEGLYLRKDLELDQICDFQQQIALKKKKKKKYHLKGILPVKQLAL